MSWKLGSYGNGYESSGYNDLMREVRLSDDPGDPWGSNIGWLFAIASVFYVEYGEHLPDFTPSPMLRTRADLDPDEYETSMVQELNDSGDVNYYDLQRVYYVLSRRDNYLRMAGKNY